MILVHGAGEHAQRALEAEGIFRTRDKGLLPVESAAEHALVERALRHVNRKITGALTDAVVPAVGVIGNERGLFRMRDGQVQADNVGWLEDLGRQGVVAVLAAFAVDELSGRTGEVPVHLAVETVARMMKAPAQAVVFTKTNLPGIMRGGSPEPCLSVDHLDDRIVSDVEAVAQLVANNVSVFLTNTAGLTDRSGPIGTRIEIAT